MLAAFLYRILRDDLAGYLEAHTDCELEIPPGSSEGKPDIQTFL